LEVSQIQNFEVIFWDFDGVIKDSLSIKADAFEKLFFPFGKEIADRVRQHHNENGGISRFNKLASYLSWSGQEATKKLIEEYSKRFSNLVINKVIKSKWVPGVLEYIKINSTTQIFYLVTATPQEEIEEIINALQVNQYFHKVIGAPTNKSDALKLLLATIDVDPHQVLMIGDSLSDYEAAKANLISFLLRRTNFNVRLQEHIKCAMITDFIVKDGK
jgi:phosphoglycolate phosphatase-like HAD superfamily hydrolase